MDDLVRDFVIETSEALEALDTDLVTFERNPSDPELLGRIFRLIHTIKGTCGFIGLPRLQAVAHAAENVLDGFREGRLAVSQAAVSAVLDTVDVIRAIIEELGRCGGEPDGADAELIGRLDRLNAGASEPAPAPAPAAPARPLIERLGGDATLDAASDGLHSALAKSSEWSGAATGADPDYLDAAVRDALCAQARGLAGAEALGAALTAHGLGGALAFTADWLRGRLAALEADPDALATLLDDATRGVGAAPPAASTPVQAAVAPASSAGPTAEPPADASTQTIRVGVDTLEHLMTVASELVLIRNQLVQTLREQPESPFAAPLHRLNQVTTELQETVMTARMQPISGAWAKLPRVVRDLARDLDKEIDLVTQGQETELDRQVLELIKDPLTHMIRNAADHGLETPAERIAAGKRPAGRITLQARHEGGSIVIEVGDDGRGLVAAKIRAKAIAVGLITEAAASGMSDAEARQLIFAPGFSTAAQVTAVSGRGVGMDVVRSNIEKIGGSIELSSVEGQGTRFTIRIPLTLTIVSALIVECSGQRFAMPQSSVVELVGASGASGKQIEYVGGAAVLRLRDRLLPLVSLQEMLGLPETTGRREACIIVAKVGSFAFGVIVDRVFDTEEIVVKPVAQVIRHLRVYSGATILGDGSVIMILDFKGMAAETGVNQIGSGEEEEAPAAEPTTALLVFRAVDGALKAAPLAEVDRIEEISGAALERVEMRTVVQYRGQLTPVVTGADGAPATEAARAQPMLVFTREGRSVGLLVREIVDIVEAVVSVGLRPAGPGSRGSLIVAGAATELIDVDACWRRALAEPEPEPASTPASTARRLLLVDRSPFSRLLLQPLLARANYDVTVAGDPAEALRMHDAGQSFDVIMADTSADARPLAAALQRAERWRGTPLLGLSMSETARTGAGFDQGPLLDTLATVIDQREAA